MNNVLPKKKEGLLKTLAIVGLFGVIIIIAWISIQIVSVFPTAINSLASLADSVYSYDPRAAVSVDIKPTEQPVIAGKEFTIEWDNARTTGSYALTYECNDDLEVELQTTVSDFKSTQCDSPYNLGAVASAKLVVNSDIKSVAELKYKIAYFKSDTASSSAENSETITILNPRLAAADFSKPTEVENDNMLATTTEEIIATTTNESIQDPIVVNSTTTSEVTVIPKETTPTVTIPEAIPKPASTTTEEVTQPKPVQTIPLYEYTYAIPVSNPNGYTDLVASYIGIGYVSNEGIFFTTGSINKNAPGAMQFSVKNAGTKTSDKWTFTANLPGGLKYESSSQIALKPNERAILTINFPAVTKTQLYNFDLTAKTTDDINLSNNQAAWTIVVIK